MITITVETDDEERAIRSAFHDGTLFRAIPQAFQIKRDGRDVGGASAPLLGPDGGPRETYISAPRPSATIIIREAPAYVPPEPYRMSPESEHFARYCSGSCCRSDFCRSDQ